MPDTDERPKIAHGDTREPIDIIGLLSTNIEPDEIATRLPDGVISVRGSAWSGRIEWHGIVDLKVAMDGETIVGILPVSDAESLRDALSVAIEEARGAAEEMADEDELPGSAK